MDHQFIKKSYDPVLLLDLINSSVSEKFSLRSTEVTEAVSVSSSWTFAGADGDFMTCVFIGGLGALRWGRSRGKRGVVPEVVIVPEVVAGDIWDGGVA